MTSFLQYWNGDVLAKITQEHVPKSINKKQWPAERWNLAFRLYYDGMATVNAISTVTPDFSADELGTGVKIANSVAKVRQPLVNRMREDLRDAATDGWGAGVCELKGAFEHLAVNNGGWTDTNVQAYDGALLLKSGMGRSCYTVTAAANFLDSYEKRATEMSEQLKQMEAKVSLAERMVKGVKDSNTIGTPEWDKFRTCLKEIQTISSKVENRLWLYRLTLDPESQSSKTLVLQEKALGNIGKCLTAVALIDGAVSECHNSLSMGLSMEDTIGLMALTNTMEHAGGIAALFVEGTGTILGGMAILLTVYVEALRAIPSIQQRFTKIMQDRNYLYAQFGVDMRRSH